MRTTLNSIPPLTTFHVLLPLTAQPLLLLGKSNTNRHLLCRSLSYSSPLYSSSSSTLTSANTYPRSLYSSLPTTSFSIIAHIDHGKSTLADRLLELTGTIPIGKDGQIINKQVLDSLKVERERGITVKSQAVSMVHQDRHSGKQWLLNLIDTPGHVDFAYEVSRSLSACQIALLVVDATQGIQSQTLSVYRIAIARNLRIIPVINKVDLPSASVDKVVEQLSLRLGLDVGVGKKDEAIFVSAKTGLNVEAVLDQIVKVGEELARQNSYTPTSDPLRALVFDSWYDSFRGVVALVSIKGGSIKTGDKISSSHSKKRYEVLDVGVNSPTAISTGQLNKGQVGWMICNMKSVPEASIGDTLHHSNVQVEALPGFKPSVPMVYCTAFPIESTDFVKLETAIQKLALNDRSVTWSRETSNALGQGIKLGLLGALHMEIFRSRLEDEYDMSVLITNPMVAYRLVNPNNPQEHMGKIISNPLEFPSESHHGKGTRKGDIVIQEPMVIGTLSCPEEYIGAMMQLCADKRGEEVDVVFQDGFGGTVGKEMSGEEQMVTMKYRLPLSEIVTDFFGMVKSKTAGFASFDYEEDGWQKSDLVQLSFVVSGTSLDALAQIVHRSKAVDIARTWTKRLKEIIPRQQYEIIIQAIIAGKIVSSEKKSSYRKDVTAGLYGGDVTRKMKQLHKQKEGKKRLKEMSLGRVQIPQESFIKLFDAKAK